MFDNYKILKRILRKGTSSGTAADNMQEVREDLAHLNLVLLFIILNLVEKIQVLYFYLLQIHKKMVSL